MTQTFYKMSANENPLGTSPKVQAAMQEAVSKVGTYPVGADVLLNEAIVEHLGRGVSAENILSGNGGCDILAMIAKAFLDSDHACIICDPAFPLYRRTAKVEDAIIIDVPLDSETFDYDIDGILAAVTPATRLLYISNPNNPTGTTLGSAEFRRLIDNLPDHVTVIYDEVYFHYVTEPDMPDAMQYMLDGANIIIIHSFSKAYGMAGMRVGYAIARPDLIDTIKPHRNPFHISDIAACGGLAALGDQQHIATTVEMTLAGRDWLTGQLRELDIRVWDSQGNFILFRCPGSAEKWVEQLHEHGIGVRVAFGLPDCIRATVSTPEGNQAFMTAVRAIMQQ